MNLSRAMTRPILSTISGPSVILWMNGLDCCNWMGGMHTFVISGVLCICIVRVCWRWMALLTWSDLWETTDISNWNMTRSSYDSWSNESSASLRRMKWNRCAMSDKPFSGWSLAGSDFTGCSLVESELVTPYHKKKRRRNLEWYMWPDPLYRFFLTTFAYRPQSKTPTGYETNGTAHGCSLAERRWSRFICSFDI